MYVKVFIWALTISNNQDTMGNLFSRNNSNNTTLEELKKLQERLSTLENLDKDGDGRVSKKEFELWRTEQNQHLIEFKEKIIAEEKLKYSKEILNKDLKIEELHHELKLLKKENQKQLKKFSQKREEIINRIEKNNQNVIATDSDDSSFSTNAELLSEEQIKKFVEDLLTDENVNIEYLPDWVERKLYINIFNILLGLLKKTVKSTSIKFIGHQIYLDMKPQKL